MFNDIYKGTYTGIYTWFIQLLINIIIYICFIIFYIIYILFHTLYVSDDWSFLIVYGSLMLTYELKGNVSKQYCWFIFTLH